MKNLSIFEPQIKKHHSYKKHLSIIIALFLPVILKLKAAASKLKKQNDMNSAIKLEDVFREEIGRAQMYTVVYSECEVANLECGITKL